LDGWIKTSPLNKQLMAGVMDENTKLRDLLREVVTSIEFDELGLGSLREKIDRLLVPEPEPLLHLFNEKTMHCVQCGIYYGDAVLATCPGKL
jgi:hypothetical protein